MDKQTLGELGIEAKVLVSEAVDLPRPSIQALMDAIQTQFRRPNRPVRMFYQKGDPLLFERLVPRSTASESEFVTPWEMVRQHTDLRLMGRSEVPLVDVFSAVLKCVSEGYSPTMFLAPDRDQFDQWFPQGRPDAAFQIPLLEDPDCPADSYILCGSSLGPMIGQIEFAVIVRMGDE